MRFLRAERFLEHLGGKLHPGGLALVHRFCGIIGKLGTVHELRKLQTIRANVLVTNSVRGLLAARRSDRSLRSGKCLEPWGGLRKCAGVPIGPPADSFEGKTSPRLSRIWPRSPSRGGPPPRLLSGKIASQKGGSGRGTVALCGTMGADIAKRRKNRKPSIRRRTASFRSGRAAERADTMAILGIGTLCPEAPEATLALIDVVVAFWLQGLAASALVRSKGEEKPTRRSSMARPWVSLMVFAIGTCSTLRDAGFLGNGLGEKPLCRAQGHPGKGTSAS